VSTYFTNRQRFIPDTVHCSIIKQSSYTRHSVIAAVDTVTVITSELYRVFVYVFILVWSKTQDILKILSFRRVTLGLALNKSRNERCI